MIPTTVTSSSSSNATTSSNCANNQQQQEPSSALIGIASLILEGRAISLDEYQPLNMALKTSRKKPHLQLQQRPHQQQQHHNSVAHNVHSDLLSSTSSSAAFTLYGNSGGGGRQSPQPSTSRAAAAAAANTHVINITTNPHDAFGGGGIGCATPLYIDPYSGGGSNSANHAAASSSAESTQQRWAQKLCQLRQSSPAASLSSVIYEPKVAVEASTGEPELVALAILNHNETSGANSDHRGDYEILRRGVMLNHRSNMSGAVGAGSSSSTGSSPGSENFLHSLQSLATTCLRGSGSPIEPTIANYHRYSMLSISPSSTATALPSAAATSPRYNYNRATPPSRFQSSYISTDVPGSASSSGSAIQSPRLSNCWSSPLAVTSSSNVGVNAANVSNSRDKILNHSATYHIPTPLPAAMSISSMPTVLSAATADTTSAVAVASTPPTSTSMKNNSSAALIYPQQGPHCDQFLRKMGLAKSEMPDVEEHFCDMSYVNIVCSRWKAYCLKMEAIIARGEPICIEVYLGPVTHRILLEQWIISAKEKVLPPTMTLPSLCSAIRSQLYFSQISAWCDLIKKSDRTIYDTGRIIFSTPTGAAGDLATTTNTIANNSSTNSSLTAVTSPSTSPGSSCSTPLNEYVSSGNGTIILNRRPRLNIFYRIKQYDSTASFNSKPNVHNFPNVNISENYSLSVCLKSLPRMNGGIPKVTTAAVATTATMPMTVESITTTSYIGVESTAATTTMTTITTTSTTKNGASNDQTMLSSCLASCSSSLPTNVRSSSVTIAMAASTNLPLDCDKKKKRVSQQLMLARNVTMSCSGNANITGDDDSTSKHNFYIDEDEVTSANADVGDSSSNCSFTTIGSSNGVSSHREKQLLKYRKRMLKRDKKQRKPLFNPSDASASDLLATAEQQCQRRRNDQQLQQQEHVGTTWQPMEQGEEDDKEEEGEEQYQPSMQKTTLRITGDVGGGGEAHIEMVSTGTQTQLLCCQECGGEKALICLNCQTINQGTVVGTNGNGSSDNAQINDFNEIDSTSSSLSSSTSSISSSNNSDVIHTPRNKAELLLQAIQRTPKTVKQKKLSNGSGASLGTNPKLQNNNDSITLMSPTTANNSSGNENSASCQVCKRQKTQHNFSVTTNTGGASMETLHSTVSIENSTQQLTVLDDNEDDDDEDDDGRKRLEADDGDEDSDNDGIVKKYNGMHSVADVKTPMSTPSAIVDKESFVSSTRLTPHIDRCSVAATFNCGTKHNQKSSNILPASSEECFAEEGMNDQQHNIVTMSSLALKKDSCNSLEKARVDDHVATGTNLHQQFKTPKSDQQSHSQQQQQCQQQHQPSTVTPPNLLQITCSYHGGGTAGSRCGVDDGIQIFSDRRHHYKASSAVLSHDCTPPCHNHQQHKPTLLRKCLPKVNLTPIFCNPSATAVAMATGSFSVPIPISYSGNDISTVELETTSSPTSSSFTFDTLPIGRHPQSKAQLHMALDESNNIPVQKSYSAPTLPNSPSLSPRFAKQAAIYKRRSRHLSDRSDRSSLGSDEQFSDEDIESCNNTMCSPASGLQLKLRSRIAASFGRKPLLGNLEESLLQKRLMPRIEVIGFKVLLGASGGFCPTQLTIPASSYFYELHGETLSTPYVCEIRLPRKGYSVPRAGTIQATLLNPMGTVVRMFVIPYDLRDMPPLHQTFIRQRILAEAATATIKQQKDTISSRILNSAEPTVQNNNNTNNNNHINNYNSTSMTSFGSDGSGGGCINGAGVGDYRDVASNNRSKNNNNNNNSNNNKSQRRTYSVNAAVGGGDSDLGHFISAEHMKRLRYSIHLRFQTSRSGRLSLHTDLRLLISRRTDCDTAAAHAKGVLEAPNDLVTDTIMPTNPKYSARQESSNNSSKI